MYDAAPIRPRKTSIVRSRGGCETCRKRRRKCDEGRPSCSLCRKNNKPCHYNALALQFRDASDWAADKVRKLKRDSSVSECWDPVVGNSTEPRPSSMSHLNYVSRRPSLPAVLATTPSDAILRVSMGPIGHKSSKSLEPRRHMTSTSTKSALTSWFELSPTLESNEPDSMQQWLHQLNSGDVILFNPVHGSSEASLIKHALSCTGPGVSAQSFSWLSSPAGISPRLSHQSSNVSRRRWQKKCTSTSSTFSSYEASVEKPTIPFSLHIPGLSLADGRYLSHFLAVVRHILPPELDFLRDVAISPDIVLNAALALGAASLANLRGSYTCPGLNSRRIVWSTDRIHKVQALHYAAKALSLATSDASSQSVASLVTTHLILLFVEVELGTFEGLRRYLTSMNKLVQCEKHWLTSSESGKAIMRGVDHSRAVLRIVAGLWSEGDIGLPDAVNLWPQHPSAVTPTGLVHRLGNDAIVSEVRMVHFSVLQMHQNIQSPTILLLLRTVMEFGPWRESTRSELDTVMADPVAGFEKARNDLRRTSRHLKGCEIPAGFPSIDVRETQKTVSSLKEGITNIVPLHFCTHEQAMDAADYAFAQLLCNEALLMEYLSPAPADSTPNLWLVLLLRIAAGLDASNCVYRNRYRRGIVVMLVHASLRSNYAGALLYVEAFMDRLLAVGGCWEDLVSAIPVIRSSVSRIRKQMVERGRKLYVIFEKPFSKRSDVLALNAAEYEAIIGREADGTLFEEYRMLS